MIRGPDAATLLIRALIARSQERGCAVTASRSDWSRWASATFVGARHLISLEGEAGPRLDAWAAALPELDFALRGHLVADLVVTRVRQDGSRATIDMEVLTVEAR